MRLEEVSYIDASYPIVIDTETVELLNLVRGTDDIQMAYLNAFLNRELRKSLLQYYGEQLDNRSEKTFKEWMMQRYATR